MTPEKLAEAREFEHCREYEHCKADSIIDMLLEYIDSQDKEIKRLEEKCRREEKYTHKYINYLHKEQLKGEKQRAALKKLGEMCRARGEEIKRLEDALVEERAGQVTAVRLVRQLDAVWITEEKTDEDRQIAREQLRAEKVIR